MDAASAPPPAGKSEDSYWWGIVSAFALDVAVPVSVSTATGLLTLPLHFLAPGSRTLMYGESAVGTLVMIVGMGIGVSQWLWILPLARRTRAQGRPEFAKGMMSGAWMVFVLNAGCWGIAGGMLAFYHG